MGVATLGIVLGTIILIGYLIRKWYLRNQDYWEKRGVTKLKQGGIISSWWSVIKGEKTFFDFDNDMYNGLENENYGGAVRTVAFIQLF